MKTQNEQLSAFAQYKGFNLLDMFVEECDPRYPHMFPNYNGSFLESDFKLMSKFGFNFVRIPLCYRNWIIDNKPYKINKERLEKIDRVIDLALKYNMHICLNFHHAPGYVCNLPLLEAEPFSLWKDKEGLDAFIFHWCLFAQRYKQVGQELSFDLVNEPPDDTNVVYMSREDHNRVITKTVEAIRNISLSRCIVIDGIATGTKPILELQDLQLVQSTRGYNPSGLTHYLAEWVWELNTQVPTWPFVTRDKKNIDINVLRNSFKQWEKAQKENIVVHCGEMGCHHHTPHNVFLQWLESYLQIFQDMNIGFALWNFRGSFGIANSNRKDVTYKSIDGYKIDEKALLLLQKFF